MEVKEIENREIWENFLLGCREKTFLDSWNWGEFQKAMGEKIWRLGAYDDEQLISVALAIKIEAKRGTFLFLPHGPNIKRQETGNKRQVLKILLEELKKIAKEEKVNFIRVSPIWPARRLVHLRPSGEGGSLGEGGERNEVNIKIFKDLGFRDAPIHMHPESTWELDITPAEEKILNGMRKTTRYLIRQAMKNSDVKIIQENNTSGVNNFNNLYQETVNRHHFTPFSPDYLMNQFRIFSANNQTAVFVGKYKDDILASAIIVFWQDIAFYHHGASSLKYPKIPVSYLLQWEAIKEAKRRGCRKYNFWGIAPEGKPDHPWQGLSLFKMGFGGYKREYLKTQDFPLSKRYWLTFIFEKLRKTKRGL